MAPPMPSQSVARGFRAERSRQQLSSWFWRPKGVPCPSLRRTASSIVAAVRWAPRSPAGGWNPGHSLDSGPWHPGPKGN